MKIGLRILLLIGIIGMFIFAFQSTQDYSHQQDLNRIQEAITQLSLKCYSTEGHYPPNIDYLKKNYGLLLNEDLYQVTYHIEGDNLQPLIRVYAKEESYE